MDLAVHGRIYIYMCVFAENPSFMYGGDENPKANFFSNIVGLDVLNFFAML